MVYFKTFKQITHSTLLFIALHTNSIHTIPHYFQHYTSPFLFYFKQLQTNSFYSTQPLSTPLNPTVVNRDWSDFGLFWSDKNTWLTHTKSTLDQLGITSTSNLIFTSMSKPLVVVLPDLHTIHTFVDFSANVFNVVAKLCAELGGCGVVWCGVVWCGVVWCCVVWCGVVWCSAV